MRNPGPTWIPPHVVDRCIVQYSFINGSYIAVVSGGIMPTAEMLDTLEQLLAVKRRELAGAPVINADPAEENAQVIDEILGERKP